MLDYGLASRQCEMPSTLPYRCYQRNPWLNFWLRRKHAVRNPWLNLFL